MEDYTNLVFLNSIINFLGASQNIKHIDFCITRLRISVKDLSKLDESFRKEIEAQGVSILQFQPNLIQLLFKPGNTAEKVAYTLKKILK